MVADGKPEDAWQLAQKHQDRSVDCPRGVRYLPPASELGDALFHGRLCAPEDSARRRDSGRCARGARLDATDAATFELLAREVKPDADAGVTQRGGRFARAHSRDRMAAGGARTAGARPRFRRRRDARRKAAPNRRALDAIQFGERLAAKLPDEPSRGVRRDLRALGVQVVRIQTIPEKLTFDLKWFVGRSRQARADRLVQSATRCRTTSSSGRRDRSRRSARLEARCRCQPTPRPRRSCPTARQCSTATKLVKKAKQNASDFTAPTEPGEYIFVCTFPGHWVRMYGVMLVVEISDAWEVKPTVPTDPMTKQPFTSK